MSVTINTSLKGVYTLSDANQKEICRSDNIITNWGMARLTGDPNLSTQTSAPWNRAFVNNLTHLFIGSGNDSPTASDHKLQTLISTSLTATNDTGKTGTTTSVDGDDLCIKFTKNVKFDFSAPATIKEVGCHWNTTFSATLSNGIFSRAIIPEENVNAGDTLFLKYELTIKTNSHLVLGSMPFETSGGGIQIPQNKSNVRYFPFYKLLPNGTPEQTLNNGVAKNLIPADDYISEYIPPIFEDFGLLNTLYIGSGNNNSSNTDTNRNTGPRKWRLQIYDSTSGLPSYSNIQPENYINNTSSVSYTSINITDPEETISILKKINTEDNIFTSNPGSNTWQRKLRFIFTPLQWKPGADRMMLFAMSDGGTPIVSSRNRYYYNNNKDCGILTTFEEIYDPYKNESDPSNPDIYVGFDYTFNFVRVVS